MDAEDYLRIKDYTCYTNKDQVSIRVNNKQFQLARYILGYYQELSAKVFFISDDHYDFRKSNLISGNKYVCCGDYMEVYDQKLRKFLIDTEDYELVKKYVWYIDANGYVISSRGNNGKAIKLHRLIMGVADKTKNEVEIDHIHHDLTDNRKSMLRYATRSDNCANRRLYHLNKSGVIGVYQHTDGGWCAQINHDGVREYLGYYQDFNNAVIARKTAEEKYFHGLGPNRF